MGLGFGFALRNKTQDHAGMGACRLWEISENLHRAELTALERDKLVAEWVELTGDQSEQSVPIESKREDGKGHRPESGVRLAARRLPVEGKTDDAKRMNVVRALKVASLSPEAQDEAVEAVGLNHTTMIGKDYKNDSARI